MITLSEMLDFIAEKAIDPDTEIVVRRRSGGSGQVDLGGTPVVALALTDDGRLRLDVP